MLACTLGLGCGLDTFGYEGGTTSLGVSSTGESTSIGATTGAPTTSGTSTGDATTEAPVDGSITFRLDSASLIDPHLFLADSDAGTTGEQEECINDVTSLVNSVTNMDIGDYKLNLLLRFEAPGQLDEMRLIVGECTEGASPGERAVCGPKSGTGMILLTTEWIAEGNCRQIDPLQFAPVNVPLISNPTAVCVRSAPADLSLPLLFVEGGLDLRDGQIAAAFDDAATPQRMVDGVISGFLSQAAAQAKEIDAPLFGSIDFWSIIDSPSCESGYPDYLPSVDMYSINDVDVPGAWLAVNFTAERVNFVGVP